VENLDISFGGRKSFYLDGIPDDGKTWTFKDDVPLGATTAEIEDGDGNTETVTFSTFPPANSGWNRVPYGSIGR